MLLVAMLKLVKPRLNKTNCYKSRNRVKETNCGEIDWDVEAIKVVETHGKTNI